MNAVQPEGPKVGPAKSSQSVRSQQMANAGSNVPTYGGLPWSPLSTPQGDTEYTAPVSTGGYYVTGPDRSLWYEPVREQGGLDAAGFPSPHGGGAYMLAQNIANFFGASSSDAAKVAPPKGKKGKKPPVDTGTGKGGGSTGTTTGTGGNTTNPTPEGGVTSPGAIDPYTQAFLDMIANANGNGEGAGANYLPSSNGGIVPSTSASPTSSTSLWLIIGILAIVGGGGWWIYHKYIKKDFDK